MQSTRLFRYNLRLNIKMFVIDWSSMRAFLFSLILLPLLFSGTLQAASQVESIYIPEKLLLITGCARSGTHYIAALLTLSGLPIKHEREGTMGTSSWTMAVDAAKTPWGPGFLKFKFRHVFHQVRDPLKTISACTTEPEETSWNFIYQHIPQIKKKDRLVVKCAKYWYYWNLEAEKKAEFTYRIEDIENVLDEMSVRLGFPLTKDALAWVPKDLNHRPRKVTYTWSDLKVLLADPVLYQNIVDMAIRYGYPVND